MATTIRVETVAINGMLMEVSINLPKRIPATKKSVNFIGTNFRSCIGVN